jgi:predicted permease
MTQLLQDLRYALRQLRKNPGFTAVTVLTLALGIGVNAAMFAVIDAVLLRPLPFPKPDQIVLMSEAGKNDQAPGSSALPNVRDWRAQSQSFEDLGWYTVGLRGVNVRDFSDFLPVVFVSPNLFSVLHVAPQTGRAFVAGEDQDGKNEVALINAAAWDKFFAKDPNAVGRTVKIGDTVYTVIGIMPSGFDFPTVRDGPVVWTPFVATQLYEHRDARAVTAVGRLKPGVSPQAAQTELAGIQGNIARSFGSLDLDSRVVMKRYRDALTSNVRPALLALQFAVLAVWLIACANVASLLLSRTTGRRREIAIRSAIGADRRRLVRQFLTESLVLAFTGAAAGLALALGCIAALRFYLHIYLPLADHIQIDARVAGALVLFSILSAVLFGLLPALQAARAPAQEALREGTPAAGTARHQSYFRDGLVVGEIALSLLLLISAGLLLRSLEALRNQPLGFTPSNLVTASMMLPHSGATVFGVAGKFAGKDLNQVFYAPLLDRLEHIPGVAAAGLMTSLPLQSNFQIGGSVDIVGRPRDPANKTTVALRAVSPNIYQLMSVRLVRGRYFTSIDGPAAPAAAIVNQAFVKAYFPNEDPIGHQLRMSDKGGPHAIATIVGVVADTNQTSLALPPQPEIDVSYLQLGPDDEMTPYLIGSFTHLVLRVNRDPSGVMPEVRKALRDFDPELVVVKIETMQELVDTSLGSQTLTVRLLWIFAAAALLISIAGIYGLLAYNVSQRTRDIGLRMALGATRSNVVSLILKHAVVLLAIGLGIGVVTAIAAGGVLRGFLYGVAPYDVMTIVGVSLLLLGCGLFASYLPARRASKIDPIRALRWE